MAYRTPDLHDRQNAAAAAKKQMLERFRAASQDPGLADKLAERAKIHEARQARMAERALEEEKGCANVLHLIVAARGALSSLMTEVIEDHIRFHVVDPTRDSERNRGAEELIEAVQAYLK